MMKKSSNKRGRGGERAFERMFTEAPPPAPGAEARKKELPKPVSQEVYDMAKNVSNYTSSARSEAILAAANHAKREEREQHAWEDWETAAELVEAAPKATVDVRVKLDDWLPHETIVQEVRERERKPSIPPSTPSSTDRFSRRSSPRSPGGPAPRRPRPRPLQTEAQGSRAPGGRTTRRRAPTPSRTRRPPRPLQTS